MSLSDEITQKKVDEWDAGVVKDIINIMAKHGITYGECPCICGRVMSLVGEQQKKRIIQPFEERTK